VEEAHGVHFLTWNWSKASRSTAASRGGLSVEQIVEIAIALADALAAVHEKGIVHRDLKPANVMVTMEGRVKVLDFGLAKDVREADPATPRLPRRHTQAGVVMGTPAYMCQNNFGRALTTGPTFSLGVVLHEMATGRRPFREIHRGSWPLDFARHSVVVTTCE